MDSLWPQAITAVSTLLAALGGVWLTQRHAERLAEAGRTEERRTRQRAIVGELLEAVRTWVSMREVLLPAFAKMNMADMTEFADTDSGRRMYENGIRLEHALTEASLEVGDRELATLISKIRKAIDEYPEAVMGPVLSGDFENVLAGLRYVWDVRDAATKLESLAAAQTRVSIGSEG